MGTIIDSLNWRYAAKRMNGKKVSSEKVDAILEAIRLSGSSMGIQPYTIIVVSNEDLKKRIQPAANNQPQIVESSHLLVFAVWEDISDAKVDKYIQLIAKTREISPDSLMGFFSAIKNAVKNKTKEELFVWNSRQAYIALGTGLVAAAEQKVDATPMEGFKAAELDAILGLKEKGLRSVALMTLGYRDEVNDPLANAKKVRRPKEELFVSL